MDPDPPSLLFIQQNFSLTTVIEIVAVLILLICSALISGTEVAFFSLTPADLELDPDKQSRKQSLVIRLLEKPKKLLATILVANNFINIAIVLIFTGLGETLFSGLSGIKVWVLDLRFLVEVLGITFLILMFGEILPKVYASRNKVKFSNQMAYPMMVLDFIISPLSTPMRSITLLLQDRLGKQKANISIDQLGQALELTSEEDTSLEEQKILKGIVSFGNTDTKQVMKPRMDVFALNGELSYATIIPLIIENGYSRIPVYSENVDNISGILYVKDLLPHIDKEDFDWKTLLRDPYFVPENKKLDDLLNEFKEKRIHLAIVVDEYGGTSGLISLEDIIEEIVGDISDEFDDEDIIFSKLDDNNYIFEGKTSLKDFYKVLRMDDPSSFEENKGEAETLAGFLLEISKGFPRKNEILNFEHYAFTIEVIDQKRIKQIKLTIRDTE
ncbi:gliding motility-associated protein GldE [Leeuwenhoekiella aequorea]|uniref:Protein involved in gliding motility GldE n=1 Tax=Leeuwenhoekiella aequorea TaxID=283736 RepID=A0A4Q0P627_9FLAO|nr:gliding motility-associated protein GldE [Leeuwenhoekiella aequorea]RXG22080.1 protein involved in gliding motility GldE [Leeuwenhoekiella aequorea]